MNNCNISSKVSQLVDALTSLGIKCRRQAFPDRTTTLGVIINQWAHARVTRIDKV